jgi:hypothetical protein
LVQRAVGDLELSPCWIAKSRRVGHIAPPKSTSGNKPCFFIICWCAEQTLQKATINLSVGTRVASAPGKLVPAAVAVEQSISYSKVKLYSEIGGPALGNVWICALHPLISRSIEQYR